jgi:hypothetical protein
MRQALWLMLTAFIAFLFVADETPSSFISGLKVMLNGTLYAQDVFAHRVELDRILASDAGNSLDIDQPTCRIALAELAANSPEKPPNVPLIEANSDRFGGNWRPTPLTGGLLVGSDLLAVCGDKIDPFSRQSLTAALAEPGSYVIRDWKNDVLQIYTPKYGLAIHIAYN